MIGGLEAPARLFYDFDLEAQVPANHMLRQIDRFLDVGAVREALKPHYSHLGRPSIDPELDLSRFDAAPLIAFIAAKEADCGIETDGRIPCGSR